MRQPVSCCWPEFRKASAESNDCTDSPADFSKRCTAVRYDSSSSMTATIFVLLSVAIQDRIVSAGIEMQLLITIMWLIGMYKGVFTVTACVALRNGAPG